MSSASPIHSQFSLLELDRAAAAWRQPVPPRFAAFKRFADVHRQTTWLPEGRGFVPVGPETRAAYAEVLRLNHTEQALARQRVVATDELGLLPMEVNDAAASASSSTSAGSRSAPSGSTCSTRTPHEARTRS